MIGHRFIGTWIIDTVGLRNAPSGCVPRAAHENPLVPSTVSNSIEFLRVSPDQIAQQGKAGRVSMCRAKASHNRLGPRGILLPVLRNKNFTHTVYFGESVWIPTTGNTSHIPYQTGCSTLHIWGRLAQVAVTDVFVNSKHSAPINVAPIVGVHSPRGFVKPVKSTSISL